MAGGSRLTNSIHAPLACLGALFLQPVQALQRYISDPTDKIVRNISYSCGANNQSSFESSHCPSLLRCVLNEVPADLAAGFQSGANIASLVPTILALIGAGPMELVQLALLSPHRALATCCFSIGLPAGLFRQLRPIGHGFSEKIEEAPREREWQFTIPTPEPGSRRFVWRNAIVRILIDTCILILTSVMLWFNWQVNTRIIVTWRCEYGWLLFAWPLACVGWLIVSLLLLLVIGAKLEIKYKAKGHSQPHGNLSLAQFMALPYLSDGRLARLEEKHQHLPLTHHKTNKSTTVTRDDDTVMPLSDPGQSLIASKPDAIHAVSLTRDHSPGARSHTGSARFGPTKSSAIIVRITMPSEMGLRSWPWYEATLEALAVGIYLYATFVLTSTQFLSGQTGLVFATIMAICMSTVRILGNVF